MTDVEKVLRATGQDRGAMAPGPSGLADGARKRLRRRRKRSAVAGAVAAAVVAVAVPVGLTLRTGDNVSGADVADGATSLNSTGNGDGFRAETWHNVTFDVPATWTYGDTTCPGTPSPDEGVVVRPDGVDFSVGCPPPEYGYGATILATPNATYPHASGHVWRYNPDDERDNLGASYPPGTWLALWYDDTTAVRVATPTLELAQRIVGSIRTYEGVDPNGCQQDAQDVRLDGDAAGSGLDGISLCRYDDQRLLAASALRTGAAANETVHALTSASTRKHAGGCSGEPDPSGILVLGQTQVVTWVQLGRCEAAAGVSFGEYLYEITPSVREVVLSAVG